LFEDLDKCTIIEETYVELRAQDGTPEFISISCNQKDFSEKQSLIKGLNPDVWRPKS
jgi:hypothetical protein